jgi:hypothetical protein
MASAWAPEARDGQQQLSKLSNDAAGADQHIALIEVGRRVQQHAGLLLEAFLRLLLSSTACTQAHVAETHIKYSMKCMLQGCGGCSEQELRARLAPYGSIAWCNGVGDGRYLVRFLTKEGASAAMLALEGASLNGSTMRMAPYSVGHMPGLLQGDR